MPFRVPSTFDDFGSDGFVDGLSPNTVEPWNIHDLDANPLEDQLPGNLFDGHSRVVAYLLMSACQTVEKASLACIRISNERDEGSGSITARTSGGQVGLTYHFELIAFSLALSEAQPRAPEIDFDRVSEGRYLYDRELCTYCKTHLLQPKIVLCSWVDFDHSCPVALVEFRKLHFHAGTQGH